MRVECLGGGSLLAVSARSSGLRHTYDDRGRLDQPTGTAPALAPGMSP
jgi:hypothetical protein